MEELKILANQFKNALEESVKQPWGKKLKHFKYRILWELRPYLKWAGKYPLAVDVELASYCNFRCTMCQQSTNWWNKEKITVKESFMSFPTLKKIVKECLDMGVYSMKVNWRGEPMSNPMISKYIKYMKGQGVHEVMMNTNASYLNVRNADSLIKSGLDRIIFSCDGLSAETYNKIRVGGDFDKFMKNIKMFKQRCTVHKKLGAKVPLIRINMSIQEANRHEIPKAKEFFKNLCDELRLNTIYSPQSLKKEKRKVKRNGCPQIYQRLIISNDGAIVPCCVDFKKQLAVGNVEKVSLREAYTRRIQAIRRKHEIHQGRSLKGCSDCDNFAMSSLDSNGKVVWS